MIQNNLFCAVWKHAPNYAQMGTNFKNDNLLKIPVNKNII